MSARKRPLGEHDTFRSNSKYTPSTPHARRALQERNSAKRSARRTPFATTNGITTNTGDNSSNIIHRVKGSLNDNDNANTTLTLIRPDGSARNILKQFAKITAPVTKRRRISTPTHVQRRAQQDKENEHPDGEDEDSIMSKRPNMTFNIEDSIEEDDSELPVAPTPSVLPDDEVDGHYDGDSEQPTITFQNVVRAASETIDRQRSRLSLLSAHPGDVTLGSVDDHEDQEGDATMMTERGRRALSEEATGRFSRYSFGSIRMSDFGSELEIRRESNRQQKLAGSDRENDYTVFDGSITMDLQGETEDLRRIQQSSPMSMDEGNSIQIPGLGDQSFSLPLPGDADADVRAGQRNQDQGPQPVTDPASATVEAEADDDDDHHPDIDDEAVADEMSASRRQTLLEQMTVKTQVKRRRRLKLTRHGTTVPSLPTSFVKRIAIASQTQQGKKAPKLGRDHIKALEQATEWFFDQTGEDLAAFSGHGRRRKRVDNEDVLLLMRRQKILMEDGDLATLAGNWLPKEVLKGLDLPDCP